MSIDRSYGSGDVPAREAGRRASRANGQHGQHGQHGSRLVGAGWAPHVDTGGAPNWRHRYAPCDVCGVRPGTVHYYRFAPDARFCAPPVCGLLVCRGFCQDVVEQYAVLAGNMRVA